MGKVVAHYVALDPGGTTGWALFDEEANLISVGQVTGFNPFLAFMLDQYPTPKVIIYENYIVRSDPAGWRANAGSKIETIQIIGAIRTLAYMWRAQCYEQPPGIKHIAEKWSGVKPPKNHAESHQVDAFNHGMYYLVSNHLKQPKHIPFEVVRLPRDEIEE